MLHSSYLETENESHKVGGGGGVSCKPQPSQVIVMSDVYLLLQNSVINLTNQ